MRDRPHPGKDSTQRFSDRVENYIRYRPIYPSGVLTLLQQHTQLAPADSIADIGSGTGISAELFLRNGNSVFGVEPNSAMRQAAEEQLQSYSNFHSITGTAESTTLPNNSVDYVVAAQAFHWFDPPKAKREFTRILRPKGWIVLIWNSRRTDSTAFLCDYEALLQQYGTDYKEIRHKNIILSELQAFFDRPMKTGSLYNEQLFDFTALKGRLLSSSYTPNEQHSNFQPMIEALMSVFEAHQQAGRVRVEYDTEVYFGRVS